MNFPGPLARLSSTVALVVTPTANPGPSHTISDISFLDGTLIHQLQGCQRKSVGTSRCAILDLRQADDKAVRIMHALPTVATVYVHPGHDAYLLDVQVSVTDLHTSSGRVAGCKEVGQQQVLVF